MHIDIVNIKTIFYVKIYDTNKTVNYVKDLGNVNNNSKCEPNTISSKIYFCYLQSI